MGIGTGAIVASTVGLMFEEPGQENGREFLHPFMIALLLSFGSAILFWGVATWLIGWGKKRRSPQKKDRKNGTIK